MGGGTSIGRVNADSPNKMNHSNGLMSGWMGGGIWLWTVVGIVLVVLLAVLIARPSKK